MEKFLGCVQEFQETHSSFVIILMGQSKKRLEKRKLERAARSKAYFDALPASYEFSEPSNPVDPKLWIKRRAEMYRKQIKEANNRKVNFIEKDDGCNYPLVSFLIQMHFYRPPPSLHTNITIVQPVPVFTGILEAEPVVPVESTRIRENGA